MYRFFTNRIILSAKYLIASDCNDGYIQKVLYIMLVRFPFFNFLNGLKMTNNDLRPDNYRDDLRFNEYRISNNSLMNIE